MSRQVRIETRDRHVLLTLERPPLNILDLAMIAELDEVIDEAAAAAPQLVTLRSAIATTFSAGVSIQDHTADKIGAMLDGFHGALAKLRGLTAVTVAEVRGRCLGGGMELAMACDLVLASESATFAQPEIELGCFPPYAAALYPRRIGRDRSLLLLTTGRTLDGRGAERWRVATECYPDEEFDARSTELADSILAKSAAVIRLTRQAVRAGSEEPFAHALEACERLYREDLAATADLGEGIDAFLEKRPPRWRHR